MKFQSRYLALLGAGVLCLAPFTQSQAAVSGQAQVTLSVESGCEVNTSLIGGASNNFGLLDFGNTSPTWSSVLTGTLAAASVGGGLVVTCDASVGSFTVAVDGGLTGNRKLVNGATEIDYLLFHDVAHSDPFPITTPVAYSVTNGAPVAVPVYGAIKPNATAVAAGVYTDTLTVTVDF